MHASTSSIAEAEAGQPLVNEFEACLVHSWSSRRAGETVSENITKTKRLGIVLVQERDQGWLHALASEESKG